MTDTQIENIGSYLKKMREARQLTLDDIQRRTKIQHRYLEALEDDNFSALPGDFYVRAFIRQYAGALNIDSRPLLGEATALTSRTQKSQLKRARRHQDDIVRVGMPTTPDLKTTINRQVTKIWLAIIVVAIIGAVWFVTTRWSPRGTTPVHDTNVAVESGTSASASSQHSATSSSSSSLSLGEPTVNTPLQTTIFNVAHQADREHQLVITANAAGVSHVKISTDKVLVNGPLAAGQTQKITLPSGTTKVNVQSTQLAHATVTMDGQEITYERPENAFWNLLVNLSQ